MVRLFKKSKLEILPEDTEKFSVKITFLTKTKGGRSFSSVTSPFSSWVPFSTSVELKLSISDGDFGGWFISDFFPKKLLHLWLQIFDYAICSEDTLEMLDTTTKRASLIQPPSVLRQLPLTKVREKAAVRAAAFIGLYYVHSPMRISLLIVECL